MCEAHEGKLQGHIVTATVMINQYDPKMFPYLKFFAV